MGEAMGTAQARSLAEYVEFFDGGVSRLAMYIKNLRMVEARFSGQLHGTTGAKGEETPTSEKPTPCLESVKTDLENRLNELEEIISSLSKNVEPTGTGKVPG